MYFKPEFKTKLVAALRSGQYTQSKGNLKNSETGCLCVLGVACDVFSPWGWKHTFDSIYMDYRIGA